MMSERIPIAAIKKLCREAFRTVSNRGGDGEDWDRKDAHTEAMSKPQGKESDTLSEFVWTVIKEIDKDELNRGKSHDPHPMFPGWELEGHIPTSENRQIAQAKAFIAQG
jgi:hypothetical protein